MSSYLFAKLVHLIAGMVYFGLPFAFGRWFRACAPEGNRTALRHSLNKMIGFTFVHLNISGLIVAGTGVYLFIKGGFQWSTWLEAAVVFMVLSLLNINFILGRSLIKLRSRLPTGSGDDGVDTKRTGRRIVVFSAVHHTLVTLITALMVFRPWT